MSIRRRLAASLTRSHSRDLLQHAAETSTGVAAVRRLLAPLRDSSRGSGGLGRWWRTSAVLAASARVRARLAAAADSAAITRAPRTATRWIRESFCYRWLTAEPEPDVVVIDLRETMTVGPMLALLDRLVDAITPSIRRSSLADSLAAAAAATRAAPVRVVSTVVLVAALGNLLVTLALSGFEPTGTALRILVIGVAAVGTRVRSSWDELRETRVGRLVAALLAPPEPPDDDGND